VGSLGFGVWGSPKPYCYAACVQPTTVRCPVCAMTSSWHPGQTCEEFATHWQQALVSQGSGGVCAPEHMQATDCWLKLPAVRHRMMERLRLLTV
jgi:hypothetical protein